MKAFVDSFSATDPTVTSLGNLSYQADATTRLTMQLSGNAPGTGTNTANGVQVTTGVPMLNPVNVIHDFVPSTGKVLTQADALRTIVDKASCNECHAKLGGIPGTESEGFHTGGRYDPGYCMVCHTDQRKYGRTNVASTDLMFPLDSKGVPVATYVANTQTVGNMPVLIHKLHLGELLANRTYNFAGVLLNETLYPQDVRNCTKCHDGSPTATHQTPQGDNWKTTPTIAACGACHDGIDFATGRGVTLSDAWKGMTTSKYGHIGGPQADEYAVHALPQAGEHRDLSQAGDEPNPQNSLGSRAATTTRRRRGLPATQESAGRRDHGDLRHQERVGGCRQARDRVQDAAERCPRDFDVYATAPVNALTGTKELWTNFVGSPSAYFVFSVPQDGIAKPSDFNASASGYIRNIWNGSATGTGRARWPVPMATATTRSR